MMLRRTVPMVLAACALLALASGLWWSYKVWRPGSSAVTTTTLPKPTTPAIPGTVPVRLSPQARKNLQLVSKPLEPTTYWRTREFPGVIVELPGVTDRGVTTSLTGVVTKVHAFPGDAVEPGAPLFTLQLLSESLQSSQLELYKASKEIEIAKGQIARLRELTESGALPKVRVIELENQVERLQATVDAYRQDLQARGLSEPSINEVAAGRFITEVVVRVPDDASPAKPLRDVAKPKSATGEAPFAFEVQSLAVELGQQVAAGQQLCHLADQKTLRIEGRGFRDDLPLLQKAAQNGWHVEVKFELPDDGQWPSFPTILPIHHVGNAIDPESHTFAFYIELANQWTTYSQNDSTRILWRFRPGAHLRLRVPVEKIEDVFVVPQAAIVWEGPEAFVFRQNGDFFDRRAVNVLHEDRLDVVVAQGATLRPGFFVAQNGAASLNRVLKAQAASGQPAGLHVHPDGTVHATH